MTLIVNKFAFLLFLLKKKAPSGMLFWQQGCFRSWTLGLRPFWNPFNLIRIIPAEGAFMKLSFFSLDSISSWVVIFFLVVTQVNAGENEKKAPQPELVVYAYDSLVAKHGLGPEIFPIFEKQCGCHVKVLPSGDGGQLLSRLQLDAERGKPGAQVVIGLDQHLWDRAKNLIEPWGNWKPRGFEKVEADYRVGKNGDGFLPFDYGVFAFMADELGLKKSKLETPKKILDLLAPEWKRNIILEDPRTSTPGLAFLLYVESVFGERAESKVEDFWKKLSTQWLTLAPGWDGAYGLFLRQEAPLVWSYTTSQAYHVEHGDTQGRYKAVLFEEGQPIQIEGAALVKNSFKDEASRSRAQAFLEFLISPEVQNRIPKTNWMLPVLKGTPLPVSFQKLPQPKKIYRIESNAAQVTRSLGKWSHTVSAR